MIQVTDPGGPPTRTWIQVIEEMTIQSYLVYAEPGQRTAVADTLRCTPGCEVTPATNRDVLVLVTESDDEAQQKQLEAALEAVDGVACLAMVGGWSE